MIYLVTKQTELFHDDDYTLLSAEEALKKIASWHCIQFDTETSGRNPHICKLLCMQFGYDATDERIVVDCTTVSPLLFKSVLESKLLIGQNIKFDLQFLFSLGIVPRKVYDTMIIEQLLHLGFPGGLALTPKEYKEKGYTFPYHVVVNKRTGDVICYQLSYALNAIAKKRLNIDIDKTVRGEIIWRGLDHSVIIYAAGDVTYLEKIVKSQVADLNKQGCVNGGVIECNAVPAIAYMEWCGILLSEDKWKAKMESDQKLLKESLNRLNEYACSNPKLQKWVTVNRQGDLFTGFDLTPKWNVDWQKAEAIKVIKTLGFNTVTQDKKTGEDKDSILEKLLKTQKGIDDKFLDLYFAYQEHYKVVSSFGQSHLDAINPTTGRLHTNFWQIGASSGRMSCGSGIDDDLARFKHLKPSSCKMLNLQQLPHDEVTRACFVAPKGYKFVSCDFSSEEARLAGDIYNDEAIIKMFKEGIDSHSMYAKIFFKEELKDIDVNDVKKLRPDLRSKAKGPEFALNFGGGATAIMQAIQCSEEEANLIIKNYEEGFKGTAEFAKKGSKEVRSKGYVLIEPITGNKMYWWDFKEWQARQASFNSEFWEKYRDLKNRKEEGDFLTQEETNLLISVKTHFKAVSKYDRMARNSPTQGTAAIIMKEALCNLFNWIVDHGYFGIIHICVAVHDELDCDYPEEVTTFPSALQSIMENAASHYCHKLEIPAVADVADFWKH